MKKKENTWSGEEKETRSKKNDRDETLIRRSVYLIIINQADWAVYPTAPFGPIN
jgi:hypothetical protein